MPEYGKERESARDLEGLFELARDILKIDELGAALDAIVHRSLSLLEGDRGFLVLTQGGAPEYRVIRNWSPKEYEGPGEPTSRSILEEVLKQDGPLLVEDAANDPRFLSKRSVQRLAIRSVLAAPLYSDGAVAGALYLESRSMQRFFGGEDLAELNRAEELHLHLPRELAHLI